MTVQAWIVKGATGISSKTIWEYFMLNCELEYADTPYDPDDFLRCYWLLKLAPEWKPRLGELEVMYPYASWKTLAESWDELTVMLEMTWPKSCASGKREHESPDEAMYKRMSKRMREIGC